MPTRLTENFTREELACKCGCDRMEIPLDFVKWLQVVRTDCGFPFPITSGYRCPDHNARVSGTGRDGPHTIAAVDIALTGEQAIKLLASALKYGFTGIGVQQKGAGRFIHLDRRAVPAIWSY